MIGNERLWSIGELARDSGLTVRALRHYDEIGLLSAGRRTAAGHRRYTEADVRRLYRIRALRGLGLPLEDVAAVLADGGGMRDVLVAQLAALDGHAERRHRLRDQVRGLLERLDGAGMPDPTEFMTTLELMSMFETYFTQDQRDRLAARRTELGADAVEAAKREFQDVVTQGLELVRGGIPADDPRAHQLAERWDAVGAPFHDGDDTKRAARSVWTDNSAAIAARMPWPAEELIELVAYLDRARSSR
ncbi:MAG: MerR family transcriptional regulator [Actinophytocola sp.]|uniref:MerR family transcriptional regulator n=1 Tax=Actinophytocola sp. TaxID=1872138 RepID=UPI001329B677|nr:MerR family transcriptional regulator [Actinophytocola sp.]MPZ81335.1 MerR family transcriptional regulator [Actinophytocola sp.]